MDTYHSHADAKMEALKALIAFLIVSIGVYLGFKQVAPPDSLPADASPQVLSSGRAMKHLRSIAQRLLGAKAFVDAHPTAKEVKVALNFEARGNGGPSIMFETSPDNGWLIGAFAQAAPYPIANSLSEEIYGRLPNDTDLTVFKDAGIAGLNFAYLKGINSYPHTTG